MNIDEMKDRIARAEEIQRYTENRCEALEKENADLERKLEQTEKDLADYQFNYSTIKELEKENAELKHQLNKNPCVCNTEWHCNDCLEQLTKAKELLAKWVELFKPKLEGFPKTPIQVDTEQFLNSEVEK